MSIIAIAAFAMAGAIAVLALLLVAGGTRKKFSWERAREDDEQMEYLAEYEAMRALERDLFEPSN